MYKILVLTDHRLHTATNSLYAFCRMIARDGLVRSVDVATRAISANDPFYQETNDTKIYVTPVTEEFAFHIEGKAYATVVKSDLHCYDAILLRLPPPIPLAFLNKLSALFPEKRIINSPPGIIKTGSKKFLLDVAEFCPPLQLINNVEELRDMSSKMPLVIKPLNSYGGAGIVKISNGMTTNGAKELTLEDFIATIPDDFFPILGMKFLKNVGQGDKRNIVVNGHIIGTTLRLPKEGGWLCNVAQGGSSKLSYPDASEVKMAAKLSQRLKKEGIIIYGFDTLVDDEGQRVLSEINTTSVGGIVQMEMDDSENVLESAVQHLIDYIDLEVYG